MYKLCFFVPKSHLESVKDALFEQGAGQLGDYERCAWQVLGQGQFLPLAGSNPFLGEVGNNNAVDEYRVETVVADELINAVLSCLADVHPYQQPAYVYWQIIPSLN